MRSNAAVAQVRRNVPGNERRVASQRGTDAKPRRGRNQRPVVQNLQARLKAAAKAAFKDFGED